LFFHQISIVDDQACFSLSTEMKACDCGKWQDNGYPCIHACAYYKLYAKSSFGVMLEEVDPLLTFESNQLLFTENIIPVCTQKITSDGVTYAPLFSKKKPGRQRKKRYDGTTTPKSSPSKTETMEQWAETNEIFLSKLKTKKCGYCGMLGHNKRTCNHVAPSMMALVQEEPKKIAAEETTSMTNDNQVMI